MIESTYIVDDDKISTFLTEHILEGFSKELKCFSSAEAALEEIITVEAERKTHPFVVFLDLNMPIMDGWDFLEAISLKQERLKNRCKIVILTSSIDEEEKRRSAEYNLVLKFLSKPLDKSGLASIQDMICNNKY
ncbi:response regulator [Pontibacter harenae]|uniref:response regulator n=1 Tax=Pontibacter harenae TaxID=2894083 RepID=UPI001E5D64FA|nr:response regulator [Pontibacter harenae]MCC9166626.1 response regulator [Pontibacter harenae]